MKKVQRNDFEDKRKLNSENSIQHSTAQHKVGVSKKKKKKKKKKRKSLMEFSKKTKCLFQKPHVRKAKSL